MKRRVFAYPYLLWMICLILAPMLLILFYAFTKDSGGNSYVFSFESIAEAFNPLYMQSLGYSLIIAAITTAVCLLMAYPIAYILAKMRPRTGAVVSVLFILPMWMNMLLRTYAWMGLLQRKGLLNNIFGLFGLGPYTMLPSQAAVVLGLVYNFLPFMIMPIYNALQKIPKANIEAAQDLGANSFQIFTKLIFPQSVPGVISGISMVFVPSISTFAVSRLLGGGMNAMYGDLIENLFTYGNNWHLGSALSLILTVLVLISMVISTRLDKDGEGATML